jgi:RNA polymerase sigma factor (sigma-70 family)
LLNLQLKGPQKYTEEALIRSLCRQEHGAFLYLYDNYAAALNGVILSIIGDTDFAGDILQEVFVKIWRQMDSYDPQKGKLFTWMYNVARNTAIDATRGKEWKTRKNSRSLTEGNAGLADDRSPSAGGVDLRGSMQELKEDHKVLVDMSYFQGYTQAEIAKLLNIPLGTVKTRLRAALSNLKKLITI